MSTIQLVIVCVTLLTLAFTAAGTLLRRAETASTPPAPARDGVLGALEPLDKVLVHIGDGQAVGGIVHTAEDGRLALADAELVTGTEKTPLPGLYNVPVGVIQGVQVLHAAQRVPAPPEVETSP